MGMIQTQGRVLRKNRRDKMNCKKTIGMMVVLMLALALMVSGCGPSDSKGTEYPKKPIEFVVPGGAGGGWDLTIRTVEKVLKDTKLVPVPMPIINKPGGGGAVTLAHIQKEKGNDKIVTVYSPPLLLINLNGSTEYSYKDTTPLAKLIEDYGAFVVAKDSKYESIKEVMDALKEDPKSIKIGGNSAVGSMDHIQFLLVAKAAGVKNLKEIDYVSFQDNAGAAQLLGGHVHLLSTGLGDVKALLDSGDLRALASTAKERVGEGVLADIPTCIEQGVDTIFINWRGLFGVPEMPEYAQKYWGETLAKMVETPEWAEACKRNGWTPAYADAEEFETFLDENNEKYKKILEEIDMLGK